MYVRSLCDYINMKNTIKFNKHNITNGTLKARVFYSIGGRTDGRNWVTVYAKELTSNLKALFNNCVNNTEFGTDYFETSKVEIFETSPFYSEVLKVAGLK